MEAKKLNLGDRAPYFLLPGTDGKQYSLSSFGGRKALIVFFSCNHCPYVQAYEDRIIALQNEFQEQGVQFVAISSNDAEKYPEDSFEKMRERSEARAFNFPYLYDETQDIARAYGAEFTPQIFLFNEERKLVYYGKVDDNWQDAASVKTTYLKDAIAELLNDKPVSVPETYAIGCTIKWKVQ